MVFSNNLLMGAAGQGGGYEIDQSIRFNDNDSSSLLFVPASSGDRRTFTFSAWVKRSNLSTIQYIFAAWNSGVSNLFDVGFTAADKISIRSELSGGASSRDLLTTQLFRDTSAWYHIIVAMDTTQSTESDRTKLYVNGTQITAFDTETYRNQNDEVLWNASGENHTIGKNPRYSERFLDGYIAEIIHVDGSALSPTAFGKYNNDGVWVPIEYEGTYGSPNGFYITGEDSADLGADYSGNGNDFTSSGLTADDQMLDSPTDNYATLNPLDRRATTYTTVGVSNGNLQLDYKVGNAARSAFGDTLGGGKWVFEGTLLSMASAAYIGWSALNADLNNAVTQGPLVNYRESGNSFVSPTSGTGSPTYGAYGATFTTGDVIRVEADFTASTVEFFKNGTSQGSIDISGMNDGTVDYFPNVYGSNSAWTVNFGQEPFVGTPTAGFNALSTANRPTPAIKDGSKYFQTTLYTGDGTAIGSGGNAVSQIENSTFQPDFVWIKRRNAAVEHALTDAVRGVTKELSSTDTGAEETVAEGLTTFGSAGFTVGSDGSYNTNTGTYVAWQWLAGNGTVSNTDGSITSTVSANTTAGFSIVGYTGNATSGATIGHGLGVTPDMIIVKNRDAADAWQVYHSGVSSDAETDYLVLNTYAAVADNVNRWNDTAPTSSVFSLGNAVEVNTNTEDYVAYCFAGVEGFSKFGRYTGNGSTEGPFIFTGFTPEFVMIKRVNAIESWVMYDTTRQPYNPSGRYLLAQSTMAEDNSTAVETDFLSNGFKPRDGHTQINSSGSTYIFMAFAEHPFGGDGVAPATAR